MKRARHWGWGGFYIVNLCAFRSSHPDDLVVPAKSPDPVGPDCDLWIVKLADQVTAGGGKLVAAWGSSVDFADPHGRPELRGRSAKVLAMLASFGEVLCIGRSGKGNAFPTHPLARGKHRVPEDSPLEVYAARTGVVTKKKEPVVPYSVKPPPPSDMPKIGSAPMGDCLGCDKPTEGRYGVKIPGHDATFPLCILCGTSYYPTIPELRAKAAERTEKTS